MPIQLKSGAGRPSSSGAKRLLALLLRPVVAGHQQADALAPDLLRERRARGNRLQADEGPELLRRLRQELAIALHDGAGVLLIPGDRPGEDHAHRVQLEQEAGDDAEIAAAAAQRPEQVGVLLLAGGDEAAVGEHDIGLEQIVDGQAIFARQIAVPAAQRQAGDAGGGNDARRHGQPEGMAWRGRHRPGCNRRQPAPCGPQDRRARPSSATGRSPGRRRRCQARVRCGRRRGWRCAGRCRVRN